MTIVFERGERTWPTTSRADWLAAYEPDLDNLRAALAWSLGPDGVPALGVNLVSYTDWLWRELALLQEQRRWFELAVTFGSHARCRTLLRNSHSSPRRAMMSAVGLVGPG
jgi:predicted ATPase